MGKVIDLERRGARRGRARKAIERMCEQLLANPLIESYEIELVEALTPRCACRHPYRRWVGGGGGRPRVRGARAERRRPRIGVLRFPGRRTTGTPLGARCVRTPSRPHVAWRGRAARRGRRCRPPGRVLLRRLPSRRRDRPLLPCMEAVAASPPTGGLVLGICNGFQILCEAGLLPGSSAAEHSLSFVCADVQCGRARRHAVHRALRAGQQLRSRSSTGRGACTTGRELLRRAGRGAAANRLRYDSPQRLPGTASQAVANEHRERLRPDAPPRARGRPAARIATARSPLAPPGRFRARAPLRPRVGRFAQPRVERAVEHVDDEVRDDDHHGEHDGEPEHGGVVPPHH